MVRDLVAPVRSAFCPGCVLLNKFGSEPEVSNHATSRAAGGVPWANRHGACRRGTAQLLSWLSSTNSASSARESKCWPVWCSSEPSAPTPLELLCHLTHQHQRLCHRRLRGTGRNNRRRHRRSLQHGSTRSLGPAPRCWQRSSCRQPFGSGGNGGGVPRPRARCNVRRARTSGDRASIPRRARFVLLRRRV